MDSLFGPGLDQATADLIVQLQLEDVGLHTRNSKGKSRDPTDEQLAFQLQNNDLESMSQLLSDRRMAMSFAAAVQADARILANSQVEEENIAKDRDIARHWTENGGFPTAANGSLSNPESTTLDDDTLDDETLSKLQLLYVSGIGDYPSVDSDDESSTEGEQAESSAWAA
ncbi:IBR finger domain-containing protein [Penicillium sp. DV-2018c]|nr:IBR finger domain-containing protein [Penicillium sp. DV-2018c]